MYSVYVLIDPRDNKPFYVGITDDIYKRFWQHVNCQGNNYEKNKRIQELRSLNLMVIVQIYEQIEDIGHARIREAYWIQHFEALGYVLTNIVRPERELKAKVLVRSTTAVRKQVLKELAETARVKKQAQMAVVKATKGAIPVRLRSFTESEEAQVLQAFASLAQKSDGKPITRTAIMNELRWNRRHYTRIIKPVCDKHNIG